MRLIKMRAFAVTHSSATKQIFSPSSYLIESPALFIYRSEVDLHLRSLWEIYGVFSRLPRRLPSAGTRVCVVGAVTYLSAVCSDSSTLAATFPSCPGFGVAGSVVEAFIIQPSQ